MSFYILPIAQRRLFSKFHFHTIKTGRIVWIEIDRCNY